MTREGLIGDLVHAVVGGVIHRDPASARRLEVDVIEADPGPTDDPDAVAQRRDVLLGHRVDRDQDGGGLGGRRGDVGRRVQGCPDDLGPVAGESGLVVQRAKVAVRDDDPGSGRAHAMLQAASSRAAARTLDSSGMSASTSGGLCGIGAWPAPTRRTGRVQPLEAGLPDAGRDLGRDRTEDRGVGDDHRTTGLANRSLDRLEVQRHQRAKVDHLGFDPFLRQRLRDPQGDVDHVRVGHDGDRRAGPAHDRPPERDQVVVAPDLAAETGQLLVHQEYDGVVATQRGLDQALGVRREGRRGDQESGRPGEPHVQAVVVLRGAAGDARRRPDDERDLGADHVAQLGCLVDGLVHPAEHEIDEVQVHDRPEPRDGRTDAGGEHRGLRDRRIEHPRWTELLAHALELRPVTAADQQVGAEDDDRGVTTHLLGDAQRERLRVGRRDAHGSLRTVSPRAVTLCMAAAGSGQGAASANATASSTWVAASDASPSNAPSTSAPPSVRVARRRAIGSRPSRHSATSSWVR